MKLSPPNCYRPGAPTATALRTAAGDRQPHAFAATSKRCTTVLLCWVRAQAPAAAALRAVPGGAHRRRRAPRHRAQRGAARCDSLLQRPMHPSDRSSSSSRVDSDPPQHASDNRKHVMGLAKLRLCLTCAKLNGHAVGPYHHRKSCAGIVQGWQRSWVPRQPPPPAAGCSCTPATSPSAAAEAGIPAGGGSPNTAAT